MIFNYCCSREPTTFEFNSIDAHFCRKKKPLQQSFSRIIRAKVTRDRVVHDHVFVSTDRNDVDDLF